jgi:hypothetical protein
LPNTKLLRQILGGQIESATGLAYRGKGLPRIRRFLDDGKISRLVIVANDVYADVGADDFRVLQEPFKGTLVYWEIRANCSAFELLGVPA